ncbi:uncharacterized protein LOC110989350 [Acanthaster planci]|uniref:Netrin receptor UNC5 n=1 Tax=Acanthaster planci TaxID=133434 RepID=A0A8B7ZVC3_ACAPL|nr:uncharacterized protein LOC110989350 [Acanthaster planci]XP_022109368.1 uncharacterized protein LOC110989350 [Acanthaster planci]XP_022109369.1 uncharacterized protein LOC110989350 [Acanthaster planci]
MADAREFEEVRGTHVPSNNTLRRSQSSVEQYSKAETERKRTSFSISDSALQANYGSVDQIFFPFSSHPGEENGPVIGEKTVYVRQQIPEVTLSEVARGVGPQWEELAKALEFNQDEITKIREDFSSSESPALELLMTWKQRCPRDQLTRLFDALLVIDKTDIARKALKRNSDLRRSSKFSKKTSKDVCGVDLNFNGNVPERSMLEKVVDEFKKRTRNMSDKERLEARCQLSDISIGYFGIQGGSLCLERYGVRLIIPPGAVVTDHPKMVYVSIRSTLAAVDKLRPGEIPLSPVIQCAPEGLKFAESVVLSFPHHAVSKRHSTMGIRMRNGDSSSGKWEDFDGNIAMTSDKHVVLLVSHFTEFTVVETLSPGSTKRLKVGAFGTKALPDDDRYTLLVYAWDNNPIANQEVMTEQKGSYQLDVFRPFEITYSKGDLNIRMSKIAKSWKMINEQVQSVNKETMWTFPFHSRTFHLKRRSGCLHVSSSKDLFCDVDIYQGRKQAGSLKVQLSLFPAGVLEQKKIQELVCPHCQSVRDSTPCSNFTAEFEAAFSRKVHGEDDIVGYIGCYGLPETRVMTLCEHLDAEKKWLQVAEHLTPKGYQFIKKAEDMTHPTKEMLKAFFEAKKLLGRGREDAIDDLRKIFEEIGFDRAVEIITEKSEQTSSVF